MRWMISSPITTGRSIIRDATLLDRAVLTGRPSRIRFAVSMVHPSSNCRWPDRDDTPPAAVLFGESVAPRRPFTLAALGLFFELSMGLSARKEIPGMSWYLRIKPFQRQFASDRSLMPCCPRWHGCRAAQVSITTHRWITPWNNGHADRKAPIRTRVDFAWD